jgi:hypothetical protein
VVLVLLLLLLLVVVVVVRVIIGRRREAPKTRGSFSDPHAVLDESSSDRTVGLPEDDSNGERRLEKLLPIPHERLFTQS